MTKALVKTQIRLQQMFARGEAGQGTLEYVGMVIVAGLLAVGLVAAAGQVGLSARFGKAITDILGTTGT